MVKILHVCAITCGLIAMTGVITALATPHWFKACIMFDNFFDTILTQDNRTLPHPFREEVLCYSTGVFGLKASSISLGSSTYPVSYKHLPQFVVATIGLLIVGLVVLAPAILTTYAGGVGPHFNARGKLDARTYTRISLWLYSISVLCLGAATLTYTIAQAPTVNNAPRFVDQIHDPLSELLSGLTNPLAFGSSDSTDEINVRQGLLLAFQHSSPQFDYSFYFSWVGVLVSVAGTMCVAVSYKRIPTDTPFHDDEAML